ncbi:MAG: SBBP repeat-containing protein [Ignavibacteriales bacterium]|nr:MAG: SBBP repeat-containing protein [Ignavibacteriales bacterium]
MKKFLLIIATIFLGFITSTFSQISFEWIKTFNGPNNGYDNLSAIALDDSGNIYVTGNASKCTTLKYNPLGEIQWIREYDNPDSNGVLSVGISIDNFNNVFVIGKHFQNSVGYHIPVIVKYNSDGEIIWEKELLIQVSWPLFLKFDSVGNIYLVGEVYQNGNDMFVTKLNLNGNQEWYKNFDISGDHDLLWDATIDTNGNVYLLGSIDGNILDIVTLKIDTNGETIWSQIFDGGFGDLPSAITLLDDNKNLIVVGDSDGGNNLLIIKYDSAGVPIWTKTFNTNGSSDHHNCRVLRDAENNIYITGACYQNGWKILTVKYNSDGEMQWYNMFQPPSSNIINNIFIQSGDDGKIFVAGNAGYYSIPYNIYDFITIEYNKLGELERFVKYNGTGNGDDQVSGMVSDRFGNIFVAGTSYRSGTYDDYLIIKYNPTITDLEDDKETLIEDYYLLQNYPNPFNPKTKISWQSPVGSHQRLKVYDMLGNEVSTLVDEFREAGRYETEFDASNLSSGVYFYQLCSGNIMFTKKMLLIK